MNKLLLSIILSFFTFCSPALYSNVSAPKQEAAPVWRLPWDDLKTVGKYSALKLQRKHVPKSLQRSARKAYLRWRGPLGVLASSLAGFYLFKKWPKAPLDPGKDITFNNKKLAPILKMKRRRPDSLGRMYGYPNSLTSFRYCQGLNEAIDNNDIEKLSIFLHVSSFVGGWDAEWKNRHLRLSTSNNKTGIAKLLLRYGADPNWRDGCLHVAISNGNDQMVNALLQYGANLNEENWNGRSGISHAVFCGNSKIAETLLRYGADANEQDAWWGESMLEIAIKHNDIQTVETLLRYGANPNRQDKWGCFVLGEAVEKNNIQMVEALLRYGANIHQKNVFGETALSIASEKENFRMIKLLIKWGPYVDSKHEDAVLKWTQEYSKSLYTLMKNYPLKLEKIKKIWESQARYLWLGYLKGENNCWLKKLPKEIIKEIQEFLYSGMKDTKQ